MTTTFLFDRPWTHLTAAVRESRVPVHAAVAYYGKGAGRLLPLSKGSRLVVDASEHAVSSGQTSPKDLLAAHRKGVRVFSVRNLHAKVFVVGRRAFVGSTNASMHSKDGLVEAILETSDAGAVSAAREFINDHCREELGPRALAVLQKLYREPLIPGGKRTPKRKARGVAALHSPLRLAQLRLIEWTEEDQKTHEAGLAEAKRRRKKRASTVESYRLVGSRLPALFDDVIQITDEGDGSPLVAPPGKVIHLRKHRAGSRPGTFVYLEMPSAYRRVRQDALAKRLGRGWKKLLARDGLVRNAEAAASLRSALKVS
ncbi:MAG: hypothetical protein KBB14_04200 [Thermoanaerobaculia bacterium]|nr:hypothetical protein [Thermoanaerobaculia bacterium]